MACLVTFRKKKKKSCLESLWCDDNRSSASRFHSLVNMVASILLHALLISFLLSSLAKRIDCSLFVIVCRAPPCSVLPFPSIKHTQRNVFNTRNLSVFSTSLPSIEGKFKIRLRVFKILNWAGIRAKGGGSFKTGNFRIECNKREQSE